MKKLNGREIKAFFVLSIMVPVGLLTTLRLSGILKGPTVIAETMTLEAIEWEFQRPNCSTFLSVDIFDVVEAFYSDNVLGANQKVHIWDYVNRPIELVPSTMTVVLEVNSTMTDQNGFIESVDVVLHKDQLCRVDWIHTSFRYENLSLVECMEGYMWKTEAYIKLTSTKHSNSIYLSARITWSFSTPSNQTHQLNVFSELTYYNGTAYKKIIQPFQLTFLGNAGNE